MGLPSDAKEAREQIVERVMVLTGEQTRYRAWWGRVVDQMAIHEGEGCLLDAVDYAADCMNPAQRELKGLGPLKNPGGYIASKCRDYLRPLGAALPAAPTPNQTEGARQ